MGKHRLFLGPVSHVMARGVNRAPIFGDETDLGFFLHLVRRFMPKEGIDLHAYVLMTNHYHLLVSADPAVLSEFMHRLNMTYVKAFNRRWDRRGHLFEGRFLSVPVVSPARVVELSCYLHQNPVTAHMVRLALEYAWSSYRYYMEKHRAEAPSWLKPEFVLDIFRRIRPSAEKTYESIMNKYRGDDRDSWLEALKLEAEQAEVE